MAERLHIAVLIVGHLNKAQTLSAIYRTGGSTSGWLGKCRAAFMVVKNPDDRGLRYFLPIKTNLAQRDLDNLEFRIVDGKLDITPSADEVDIDTLLAPKVGRRPERRARAAAFLEEIFEDREKIPATEIKEKAEKERISKNTLERAKKDGGYTSEWETKDGVDRWVWKKPGRTK